MKVIDLRSDTVTQPSQAMRLAMMQAEVGDDVLEEDPTIQELEKMSTTLAGMEAALFVPSGTQSNLAALMSHCERGDEYIAGQTAHAYCWEGGGAAVLGSIQPQPLDFEPDGTLDIQKISMAIKPVDNHHAHTKLVCLENTTNGKVLPLEYLKNISDFCQIQGLKLHLDGARVFNAVVELGINLRDITQYFDSISICLSKGLGAPVGSILCGKKDFIQKAKRWRKVLGGGMRQAGILAAAGIYAFENNILRLKDDHQNAKVLAKNLCQIKEISLVENSLHTNMLYIHEPKQYEQLQQYLQSKNIFLPKEPNKKREIRLVTHLNISPEDIQQVTNEITAFYNA